VSTGATSTSGKETENLHGGRWAMLVAIIGAFAGAVAIGGCAAKGPSTFAVPAGEYVVAFESAREVLRNRRFPIERVDSEQGVLTTAAKPSSGFATPWDLDQTTVSQEFSDLVNQQNRRVRVTFENADGVPNLNRDGAIVGRVDVVVYRMQDYSLRPASRALLFSTRSTDPTLSAQGIYPQYEVPSQADSRLADRVARDIEREMATRQSVAAQSSATE